MLRFFKPILIARKASQFGIHAAILGIVLMAQYACAAPIPVYTTGLQPGDNNTQGGGDYSVGGAFRYTGSNDAITALGLWDQGQNGLASPHNLGLWDSVGNLLASVTIPSGTGTALIGEYRYANLSTPVSLISGAEYVLGADMNGSDSIVNSDGNYPVGYAAGFTYPASGFGSGTYNVPGNLEPTIDPNTGFEPLALGVPYLGPNALFAPVPEPASGLLLLVGMGLVCGARARLRKK